MSSFLSPAFAQVSYTPPAQSASVLRDIPFNQAVPVDEAYRKEFENCDQKDTFRGFSLPIIRRCKNDPNNVKALLKFSDGTIFIESKLSLDIDGSWLACKGQGAPTSQCPTSFSWPTETQEPNKFVDPDNFAYIVNPVSNFQKSNDPGGNQLFEKKTGVKLGDLGVVVYKNKVVPVFVADSGPYNKLGEGSSLLHQFNSKISDLSPSNAVAKINAEALKRFENLKDNRQGVIQLNQPQSGQSFAVNTAVTFSGTANPEVSRIKVSIGPGGLFEIADLKNIKKNWTFQQVFNTKGIDRPVTIQPFNATDKPLKPLNFTITIQ